MKTTRIGTAFGIVLTWAALLAADTIELSNGDRVTGKLLDVDDGQLVFETELLGKITLPREKVVSIQLESQRPEKVKGAQPGSRRNGRSESAPRANKENVKPAADQQPPGRRVSDAKLIQELRARGLRIGSLDDLKKLMPEVLLPDDPTQSPEGVVRNLRQHGVDPATMDEVKKMVPLIGVPGARSYFDSMLGGLINGRFELQDLRRDAIKARDGLRDIQKDLGPNGDALNGYLMILESFLDQTEGSKSNAPEKSTPGQKWKQRGGAS